MDFQAPIPGQSLTTAPGNMPYERPPEITDPEEAIQMHIKRLIKPQMTEDLLDMLELDTTVKDLTEGLLRSAVAAGIHSVDVSLSIAPVIHELITTTAENAGIEFDEGLTDKEAESKKQKVAEAKAAKMLSKMDEEVGEPEVEEEEVQEEEAPSGLIQRRA
jgi:hypothetical protein